MGTAGFNKDSVNLVLNGGNVEGTNITGLLRSSAITEVPKQETVQNIWLVPAYLRSKNLTRPSNT